MSAAAASLPALTSAAKLLRDYNGNEAFQANIKDVHHLTYLANIEYLRQNQKFIEAGLDEQATSKK